MRLSSALILSSLLFASVHGGRKHHKSHSSHQSSSSSSSSQSSGVSTPIVESDHVASASQITQASQPVQMAQSRSASLAGASERISSPSNAGYSSPIYSSPYDPTLMSESTMPEQTYYDPLPHPHHHSHSHSHPHHVHQPHQQVASAGATTYHHAPVQARHAPAAAAASSAVQYQAAASSVAPYAAAAPYAHPHQQYYGGGYAAQAQGYDGYGGRYAAQGSAHAHDAYGVKRGHGYGGYGWHPDLEIQTLFFIGIPLIIIPLLFLWPYFLYSLHYRGGHGGYGYGYRASDGTAEVVSTPEKELKKKTDELTKKVVPKLSKKSEKSNKSSDKKSSSSDKS